MNLERIGTLFGNEVRLGRTNFFVAFAIVMPLVLSLLVTMVFGNFAAERPRLGLYDKGQSELVGLLMQQKHLDTTVYDSEAALRDNVNRGVDSVGMVIPENFDEAVRTGARAQVTFLRWGQGLLKNQVVIESAIAENVAKIAGLNLPLQLEVHQLGQAEVATWDERLLPLIVLMAVTLAGMILPAASLVDEKQRHTLGGVTVTPATLFDVYASKALLGVALGMIMGLVVLVINGALGGQPVLLIAVLAITAVAASIFGVLLGSFIDDINSFMAIVKAVGLLLYAPGFLELIPRAPQWLSRIFPTYYLMNPVLEVSQRGAGLVDILPDLGVLLILTVAALVALSVLRKRLEEQVGLAA